MQGTLVVVFLTHEELQRHMRDAHRPMASREDAVAKYESDGDVTFASSVPPTHLDRCSLTPRWLLDAGAAFHVTSHREWFSTFSSGSFGCMHLHGSAYEIAGAREVCLSLPNGASYTLRHVRYVP